MSTATLTLYKLDAELTDLLAYRQERVEDHDSPASAEELEACDGAIRQYMQLLPRKVDNVASFIRHCESLIEEDDKEIARYRAHRAAVIDNRDRVKDVAAVVLERQPMPSRGCRKLVGSHSTLILKGNGGVQPLVISKPELIPDELCEWQGKMDAATMEWVLDSLLQVDQDAFRARFARVPSNSLIREALIQPCATCDGTGEGLGCVTMAEQGEPPEPCQVCGGSGRSAVPGAHLAERGSHLEVK